MFEDSRRWFSCGVRELKKLDYSRGFGVHFEGEVWNGKAVKVGRFFLQLINENLVLAAIKQFIESLNSRRFQ